MNTNTIIQLLILDVQNTYVRTSSMLNLHTEILPQSMSTCCKEGCIHGISAKEMENVKDIMESKSNFEQQQFILDSLFLMPTQAVQHWSSAKFSLLVST